MLFPARISNAHTFGLEPQVLSLPLDLKTFPAFLIRAYLFFLLSNDVPSFDAATASSTTEGVTAAQMFSSLEWGASLSTPVRAAPWIFKTHSQPFIRCCWNNNVSWDPCPPPLARTTEGIHDFPRFSTWDRRFHHLIPQNSSGFIIWLTRRRRPWVYSGDSSL